MELAVKCLEMYVEVAESAGDEARARACSAIGSMYNTMASLIYKLMNYIPICLLSRCV